MSTEVTLEQIALLLDEKLEKKFEEKLAPIHKILKSHTRSLRQLKENQNVMIEMLDREQMKLT